MGKFLPYETIDADAQAKPGTAWPRYYEVVLQPGDTAWHPTNPNSRLSFTGPTVVTYVEFQDGGWEARIQSARSLGPLMDKATEEHVAYFTAKMNEVDQIGHLRLRHGLPLALMRDRVVSSRIENHIVAHQQAEAARRKEPCYHDMCGVSRGLHAALVGDHEFTERP